MMPPALPVVWFLVLTLSDGSVGYYSSESDMKPIQFQSQALCEERKALSQALPEGAKLECLPFHRKPEKVDP